MVDLIQRKRDGFELSTDEVNWLIQGYCDGSIPDYQMSAWTMAVFYRGMSARETADLTLAMARSGDQIDLSHIEGIVVDKHSTGGVGDTTTLVLAPLVSAVQVPVAKMSGRGLGHTGGTIDKLESIQGFSSELTKGQFIDQVNRIGVAVTGQSGNLTPADKKLYALRDVTATVDAIPLIASSIMSKKIAAGADAILLDVKVGHGAFMKSMPDAIQLAKAMVEIGTQVGRNTIALVSAMEEPLGYAVGNALELKEAIDTLQGRGPDDLEELCLKLGSYMMILGDRASDEYAARQQLKRALAEGRAWDKFKQLIAAQGGSPARLELETCSTEAVRTKDVKAEQTGYVTAVQADLIGLAAMLAGAGRATKDDAIDPYAGVLLRKKIGDPIQPGETLATLYHNKQEQDVSAMVEVIRKAYAFGREKPHTGALIRAVVTKDGVRATD